MEDRRDGVRRFLIDLEAIGEVFVGPLVHEDVANCKYPVAWIETLKRYVELAESGQSPNAHRVRFYMDLCATVLTKRIIAIDIHRIVGGDDPEQTRESSDTRLAHAIMFKMSVSRMLACVCECVLKNPPSVYGVMADESDRLYRRLETMLKEKFYKNPADGKYYGREKFDVSQTVHDTVDEWLLREALPNVVRRTNALSGLNESARVPSELSSWKTRLLSSDLSFFGVSHVYWLWLHLTAAGLQTMKSESDFLALFYAFDLFIFCSQCSSHFLQHRAVFYTRDPQTVSVRTGYSAPQAVYAMHNIVNRETDKKLMPLAILSDYSNYWIRTAGVSDTLG